MSYLDKLQQKIESKLKEIGIVDEKQIKQMVEELDCLSNIIIDTYMEKTNKNTD